MTEIERRRLIVTGAASARRYGCAACAWTLKPPTVGAWGWKTGPARAAVLRAAYQRHVCTSHPKEPTK